MNKDERIQQLERELLAQVESSEILRKNLESATYEANLANTEKYSIERKLKKEHESEIRVHREAYNDLVDKNRVYQNTIKKMDTSLRAYRFLCLLSSIALITVSLILIFR